MTSGVYPGLYAIVQAVIDYLPTVPEPSAKLELPLSIVDGFTRAFLLCNLIPPVVTSHALPIIATSPWTLLVSSLVRNITRVILASTSLTPTLLIYLDHG
jgi:hypothetical protein